MKRFLAILSILVLFFCAGCKEEEKRDIVPQIKTITSLSVQRTNIDDGEYSYFEKVLVKSDEIVTFYDKINSLEFEECDPISYSSFDYLLIWEGKKSCKMVVVGNNLVIDGTSYVYKGKDKTLSNIIHGYYKSISSKEISAKSRILEKI